MAGRGGALRAVRESFRQLVQAAQADTGLVVAQPVVPDADTGEILAETGDPALLETVRDFLTINRWPFIPGPSPRFEPSVWRVSPSHEIWIPLLAQDHGVGLVFLAFQAPRQWTPDLQRKLNQAIDDLTVDVALWRSRIEATLFRSIVEQSQDGMALMDNDGKIVYANPAYRQRQSTRPQRRDTPESDQTTTEIVVQGQVHVFHNRYFPVVLPDGIRYRAVVQRDVTESRRLMQQVEMSNAELRAMNDRLEKAQVTQKTFLAMVTHELKTPLHLLKGALETVSRLGGNSAPDIWSILQDSAKQLEILIDDLLTVTRLQTGSLTVSREPVDVVREVEQCVRCWSGTDNRVVYEPPTDEIPIVLGDARRLRQIFDNLIGNGLDYCRHSVRVAIGRDHDALIVQVTDDGPGIPPSIASKIFDPFYRGPGAKAGGMGLGLAVAKGLATAHGGDLIVQSLPTGTMFELRLPFRGSPARTVRYRWAHVGQYRRLQERKW